MNQCDGKFAKEWTCIFGFRLYWWCGIPPIPSTSLSILRLHDISMSNHPWRYVLRNHVVITYDEGYVVTPKITINYCLIFVSNEVNTSEYFVSNEVNLPFSIYCVVKSRHVTFHVRYRVRHDTNIKFLFSKESIVFSKHKLFTF